MEFPAYVENRFIFNPTMALQSSGQAVAHSSNDNIVYTSELSESLIGNKDLKFKLLGDAKFLHKLVCEFSNQVQVASTSSTIQLQELEKCSVVIRTLSLLLSDIDIDKHENILRSIKYFDEIESPILQLFQCYLTSANGPDMRKTISQCIDTLITLNNKRQIPMPGGENLCKFIVLLMMIGEDELLVKLLKLIPLVLQNGALSQDTLVTLVSVLLKRVSTESDMIMKAHLPHANEEFLYDLAFNNDVLPNIELDNEVIDNIVDMRLLTEMILRSAQIFKFMLKNNHQIVPVESLDVILPTHVYVMLQLFFKNNDKVLGLAALNLMDVYLGYLKPRKETLVYHNYKKLFPHITKMLHFDNEEQSTAATIPLFLSSPGGVLVCMCTLYPLLNDYIKDTNTDHKIIAKIERLYKGSSTLKGLSNLKKSLSPQLLLDFTSLMNNKTQLNDDSELADLIWLLAIYTGSSEDCRLRVTNVPSVTSKINLVFARVIADLIDNYAVLLIQVELTYKLLVSARKSRSRLEKVQKDLPWIGKNLGFILALADSPVYSSTLLLARSLSRSLSILRTFFVECDNLGSCQKDGPDSAHIFPGFSLPTTGIVMDFLEMLRVFSKLDWMVHFFKMHANVPLTLENQSTNKTTLTGIMANFILDFSSFRQNIVRSGTFLNLLSTIYKNAVAALENGDRRSRHQQYMIQLNVLQLLKNYMFNETNSSNTEILDHFPLTVILEQTFYGFERENTLDVFFDFIKLQKKLVGFDILRNLTAGLSLFAKIVVKTYEDNWDSFTAYQLPEKWFDYVISTITNYKIFKEHGSQEDEPDLISMIMCSDYVKLVTSLNFIENHKYITINKIEKEWFPNDRLLSLWKDLLSLSVEDVDTKKYSKVTFHNNLNDIKLSIIWILTNLTWKTSNYGFSVRQECDYNLYETLERRAQWIIDENIEEEEGSGLMSVSDRAKYLTNFGFADVLKSMIEQYSELPRRASMGSSDLPIFGKSENKKNVNLKRFDIQNSYDLLERAKSAYSQLLGLTKKKKDRKTSNEDENDGEARARMVSALIRGRNSTVRSGPRSVETRSSADAVQAAQTAASNFRNLLNIRPDVNRGGEGFGYDLLDANDEIDDDDIDDMDLEDHTTRSGVRRRPEDDDEWDQIEEDDLEFVGGHG